MKHSEKVAAKAIEAIESLLALVVSKQRIIEELQQKLLQYEPEMVPLGPEPSDQSFINICATADRVMMNTGHADTPQSEYEDTLEEHVRQMCQEQGVEFDSDQFNQYLNS